MPTYALNGANIIVYINNVIYNVAQSVSFTIDYGVSAQFGIDSPYAQELAPGKVSVSGSIQGLRIKNSGGLQGKNMRPLFTDIAASPYISIRIQDRQSKEDIFFCQTAMVTKESHVAAAKGGYKMNIEWTGLQPLMALDRA